MAYVTIPKDLTKVKSKVLFGLTRRQLICFGAAVLVGVPLFFCSKSVASSAATLCMILVMLPFFLLAMYEKTRPAIGGDFRADDPGHVLKAQAAALRDQQFLCRRGAADSR